jgi:hypothetical protein
MAKRLPELSKCHISCTMKLFLLAIAFRMVACVPTTTALASVGAPDVVVPKNFSTDENNNLGLHHQHQPTKADRANQKPNFYHENGLSNASSFNPLSGIMSTSS